MKPCSVPACARRCTSRPLWPLAVRVTLAVLLLSSASALVMASPRSSAPPDPAAATAAAATRPGYRVIVNPRNPAVSIQRKVLAEVFLKRTVRWPVWGMLIAPVDQQPGSPARKHFSEEVLKRSVAAVKTYWHQAVFAGRDVPPAELDEEEHVVRYVRSHEGAVGYVSAGADIAGTKVLSVR